MVFKLAIVAVMILVMMILAMTRAADVKGNNLAQAAFPQQMAGSIGNIPTVRGVMPFNPVQTCSDLKNALSGVGRDSAKIMRILGTHNRAQRFELAATYKSLYGKDLVNELLREYYDNPKFEDAIQYIFWPAEKMFAREYREAVRGLGTNELALIDMTVTLTAEELRKTAAAYQEKYQKKLDKDVKDDTSGFFKDVLLCLIQDGRQPDHMPYPSQTPYNTAEALANIGSGNWDKQKDAIRDIFCKKSFSELRAMFDEYQKKAGHSIETAITREFKRYDAKLLLAIASASRSLPAYLAETLKNAVGPVGSKFDVVNRVIIGRSEIDLGNVKEEFYKKYNENIDTFLKHFLEGYYWDLMVLLAGFEPQLFSN